MTACLPQISLPAIPESLARPELGRLMPLLPLEHEQTILMLMNVLMIEIRAEAFFSFCWTASTRCGSSPTHSAPNSSIACRKVRLSAPPK